MTDAQLQQLLDWIPTMLLAVGVLCTTLVGLYIQVRTKIEVEKVKEQGKEIIHQTNSANSALQTKFDLATEKIIGLERLLAAQVDATKAAAAAISVPGPQGPQGETGPQGEKGRGILG